MIDTTLLKAAHDLRHIVEQDLGPAAIRSGRASLYKCPFHHERKGFSLAVWRDGYRCFGKCDQHGDLLDWLMSYRRLSFTDALAALGGLPAGTPQPPDPLPPPTAPPPDVAWQSAASQVVAWAQDQLWAPGGARALTYLLERGLTTQTIREAGLGYVPGGIREWESLFGLQVPCGITIPWWAEDELWAVKVRRAAGAPKYVQIAGGSTHGLFNADWLHHHTAAVFCEGEFDALLIQQEAGDLVAGVTLGSASTRLTARWYGALVGQHTLLIAYDRDPAGQRGAEHLLSLSARFRSLPVPQGKDVTEFHLRGGNLYSWIATTLPERLPHAP